MYSKSESTFPAVSRAVKLIRSLCVIAFAGAASLSSASAVTVALHQAYPSGGSVDITVTGTDLNHDNYLTMYSGEISSVTAVYHRPGGGDLVLSPLTVYFYTMVGIGPNAGQLFFYVYNGNTNIGMYSFGPFVAGYVVENGVQIDSTRLAPTLANLPPPPPLYHLCPLYDSDKAVNSGATVPIKLQLCTATGVNLSSSDLVLHGIAIVQASGSAAGDLMDAGNSNPDNDFRYDPTLGGTGGYIFNLKTTGLPTGTFLLNFKAGTDPFTYSAAFQVR